MLPSLPHRSPDSHKGTFGSVAVVGGAFDHASGVVMLGAPALAATAALRAGAGLVRIVAPAPVLSHALTLCPSATGLLLPDEPHLAAAALDGAIEWSTCLAVGPGLGTGDVARAVVLRAIAQDEKPLVLDADGLNALAHIPEFVRDFRAAAVLTPHPGEFRTLCRSMNLKDDLGIAGAGGREDACRQLAQRLGRIVVLKGRGTVVSDGQRTWTCGRGHPCLATAGTGDVLTGLIAGLVAQFVAPLGFATALPGGLSMPRPVGTPLDLFGAACLGVEIHARAGEAWAQRHAASAGLLALELADELPPIIELLRA